MRDADAERLAESWQLALRAERKSPQTLKSYGEGVRQLPRLVRRAATPRRSPGPSLNLWVAAAARRRARRPRPPGPASSAVRRFSAWLAEEGEIPADPFLGVKAPKLDEQVIEPLTDDELTRAAQGLHATQGRRAARSRCATAATRPSSG